MVFKSSLRNVVVSSINGETGDVTIGSSAGTIVVTTPTSSTINLEVTPALAILAVGEIDDGNSGTSDTIDFSAGAYHKSTLTGNVTYTFTAPPIPGLLQLKVVQGSGPYTITWPANIIWPGNIDPKITTTNGATDLFTFYYDGTSYWSKGIAFNES